MLYTIDVNGIIGQLQICTKRPEMLSQKDLLFFSVSKAFDLC